MIFARSLFKCGLIAAGLCTGLIAGLASAQQPTVDELIAAAKSSDETAQLKAIQELGSQGATAVPALTELLKAESPVVRAYAARSLGHIGPDAKGAAENLIALLGDSEVTVRRQAIDALKNIRPGPKVAVPLFAKLMHDSDPGIRMRVMEAVADAKGNAVPALIEALKNPDADYWACIILRDIGPDAAPAVPALVAALKNPRPEIRREATLALAAIGSADAVDAIVPLLKDQNSRVAATFALGAIDKVPPEAESVIRANVNSDDPMLGTVSLWVMGRLHPDDMKMKRAIITRLVEKLKDQDPFVRTAAARALSSLPPSPEIAGPIFAKALTGADETTVHYLLDAVAGLGAPAVPRLIGALKYKPLRPQIAGILGRIGPPAAPAAPELAKLLTDEDPNVAIEAAHALANIGPGAKDAVPALVEVFKQPESQLTFGVAYALGRIGPAAAAAKPVLLEKINSEDSSLSLLCAWALVQIEGKSPATAAKVLPELAAGLKSNMPKSRQMAAEILGDLGPAANPALGALEQATKDRDAAVRDAATKAVAAVRG